MYIYIAVAFSRTSHSTMPPVASHLWVASQKCAALKSLSCTNHSSSKISQKKLCM